MEGVSGEEGRILSCLNKLVCPLTSHFPLIQDKVKTKVRTLAINVNSYNNSVEKYRQCQRKLMIHGQMEGKVKCHWRVKS